MLLLVASQLLSVLALLVRRHRTWHEYLLLAMMLGGLVQVVANAGQFPAVELMVPGYWLVPMLVVSLRSPDRGHHARFVALAALATMGVQHVITREAEWIHWADQLWIVQPALETWMFGDAVTLVARQVDRSRAAELAARADLREQRVQASARREAARVLHDHVLHALIALSRVTDGPSGERAVAQCREAGDALRTQTAGIGGGSAWTSPT